MPKFFAVIVTFNFVSLATRLILVVLFSGCKVNAKNYYMEIVFPILQRKIPTDVSVLPIPLLQFRMLNFVFFKVDMNITCYFSFIFGI